MNKEEKMKNKNNNVNKDQEINKKRKKNNNNNNQDCNHQLTPPTRFPSDFGDNEKLNDSLALSLNSHYQSWSRRVPPPQEVAVDPPLPLSPPPQEAPPLPPQQQLFMKPPQEAPPLPLSPPPLPPQQQLFMRLPQEAPPLPPQQLFMRPPQEAPPLPHPQPRPTSQPLFMQSLLAHNPSPLPLQLSSSHPLNMQTQAAAAGELPTSPPPSTAYRPPRARRNPTQAPRGGKSDTVPAPFPWATTRRATVHSLDYLLSREMYTITGDVQCKRCEKHYEMELDLKEKFMEVGRFIAENKSAMHDRAPGVWMNPALPACKYCEQENMVKPVIAEKKKSINWLFLLLGQMLGCCTLEQLKYFCKHTKNHRTGAKDRVLYLTYLALCKQLDPKGPFER